MWIIPNNLDPESSPCARESLFSMKVSDLQFQLLEQHVWSRGKPTLSKSWSRKWKREAWLQRLSGRTCLLSAVELGAVTSTSSSPAFPASPQVLPADAQVSTMTVGSGRILLPFSKRSMPRTSSSRTSRASARSTAAKASTKSSVTWPVWGSTRSTVLSERPTWALPTDETASSSSAETEPWSTPRVAAARTSKRCLIEKTHWAPPSLEQMAELQQAMLPHEFVSAENLTPQAKRIYDSAQDLWPSPMAADSERGSMTFKRGNPTLKGAATSMLEGEWSSPKASDGEKGGPNMRGSKGDQMLPSQVVSMVEGEWQTPSVAMTTGGHRSRSGDRSHELLLNGQAAQMTEEGSWPTPAARDFRSGEASPEMYIRNARPLNEAVIAWMEHLEGLWPTPYGMANLDASGKLGLGGEFAKFVTRWMADEGQWATPSAAVVNDGEGPETWRARQAGLKLKGYNGNGAGLPLTIQSQEVCLSSHPALDHFVGLPSPITDQISSPHSPQTEISQSPAPSTRSTSRGGTLVRLNPQFVSWLMAGSEMLDQLHVCSGSTVTALALTA